MILSLCGLVGCTNNSNNQGGTIPDLPSGGGNTGAATIPAELAEIPSEYNSVADEQGTLIELWYDTYESFSYAEQSRPLEKRAIVYLPYGYSENSRYNVMYIMHGGWSNETGTLGTHQ